MPITTIAVGSTSGISGGGVNTVTVTVDFGASFTHYAEVVVSGQSWVTAASEIAATPLCTGSDYMEYPLFQFSPVVHSLVAGVGFTLGVYTPIEAKGSYTFSCVGA